jgi:hypothetical protein
VPFLALQCEGSGDAFDDLTSIGLIEGIIAKQLDVMRGGGKCQCVTPQALKGCEQQLVDSLWVDRLC